MILRSDLPIKYYLGVYHREPLYDEQGVLFDILQYLIKVIVAKGKQVELENLKFSSKSLKYVFGDKMNDETFKADLIKRIKLLIVTEYLKIEGETIYITQKGLTNFYTAE